MAAPIVRSTGNSTRFILIRQEFFESVRSRVYDNQYLPRICHLLDKDSAKKTGFSWIPAVIAILLIAALLIPTAIALSRYETEQPEQKTDGTEWNNNANRQ